MFLQSLLLLLCMEADGRLVRLAMGAWTPVAAVAVSAKRDLSVFSGHGVDRFHRANLLTRLPSAILFHPSDPPIALQSIIRNALSQRSTVPGMIPPSSLGVSSGRGLVRSPTARLDEHRLSNNTMDLVCAFGEHRRSTSPYAPPFLVCREDKD
jgi:hypothetical protein